MKRRLAEFRARLRPPEEQPLREAELGDGSASETSEAPSDLSSLPSLEDDERPAVGEPAPPAYCGPYCGRRGAKNAHAAVCASCAPDAAAVAVVKPVSYGAVASEGACANCGAENAVVARPVPRGCWAWLCCRPSVRLECRMCGWS